MSLFRTTVHVSPEGVREPQATFDEVLVDTGSEFNWFPAAALDALGIARQERERFETADGRIIERDIGFAHIYAAGRSAPAIVVFGEPGDKTLLGAVGLEPATAATVSPGPSCPTRSHRRRFAG